MSAAYDTLALALAYKTLGRGLVFLTIIMFSLAIFSATELAGGNIKFFKGWFVWSSILTFIFFLGVIVSLAASDCYKVQAQAVAFCMLETQRATPDDVKRFLSYVNEELV